MAKGGNVYIPMPKVSVMTSDTWSLLSVAKRKEVVRGLKKEIKTEEVKAEKVSIFKRIFGGKK